VPLKHEYEVKLDVFEGPLDLLLYLVQRDEVDIAQISVARVTEQYLSYLELMRELNINVAAEYLHMASVLVRLKAHEILPSAEPVELGEEDGIYSRDQLIQQLLEYKKYKEAARSLRQFEAAQAGTFPRGAADEVEGDAAPPEPSLAGVSVFDHLAAFRRVLEQAAGEEPGHVVAVDTARLDDRLEHVLAMVREKDEVRFEDLFIDDHRRIVLVVTFMALLELIKMQEIVLRQEENFGAIFVARRSPETREPEEGAAEAGTGDEAQEGAGDERNDGQ
jgi:segregation and condensation protein A